MGAGKRDNETDGQGADAHERTGERIRIEGVSVGLGGEVIVVVGEEGMRIWRRKSEIRK